jgi:hypothetical protein
VVATNHCPTYQHFGEVAVQQHKGLVVKMLTEDSVVSSSKTGLSVCYAYSRSISKASQINIHCSKVRSTCGISRREITQLKECLLQTMRIEGRVAELGEMQTLSPRGVKPFLAKTTTVIMGLFAGFMCRNIYITTLSYCVIL